jgi:hypothetical protein
MQAIALITGDELLLNYNVDIETHDVINYMRNLTWKWAYMEEKKELKTTLSVYFDDKYGAAFTEVITPYGICYTFNNPDAQQFFNLQL